MPPSAGGGGSSSDVVARFAQAPAGTEEEVDELLSALLHEHSGLEDGKWVRIVDDFKRLSAESKSKQWLQRRAKKLQESASGAAAARGPPVRIEHMDKYGRVLIATADIPRFSVVVAEPPLIVGQQPVDGEDKLQTVCREARVDVSDAMKLVEFLKAFCAADEAARAEVLKCYHPERFDGLSESAQAFLRLCDAVKGEPWAEGVPKELLEKVTVIKLMNAHPFSAVSARATAVFEHISVPTNACRPNAVYTSASSAHPGCGCLIARRPIATGEQVTLSYCEPFMPRTVRLAHLQQTYSFCCDCAACTEGPDIWGCVPCPTCHPRGEEGLVLLDIGGGQDKPGYAYRQPQEDASPWLCDACGGRFADDALRVGGMHVKDLERNLFREHRMLEAQLASEPNVDLNEILGHVASVVRALGPRHGIAAMASLLLCEVLIDSGDAAALDGLDAPLECLLSVVRRNGDHPGEMLPILARAGHAFVRKRRFERAAALYETALEFLVIYGESSPKVKEVRKGLQACAKSDPKLVRGL